MQTMLYTEVLLKPSEYNKAKHFIKTLRNNTDDAPRILKPDPFPGAKKLRAPQNAVRFCERNPGFEPVFGFKLYELPRWGNLFMATVHATVRTYEDGKVKYVDMTPPEPGDNRSYIFVPSTRLYNGRAVKEIVAQAHADLQPKLGNVCQFAALQIMQEKKGWFRCATSPDELDLVFCPHVPSLRSLLGASQLSRVVVALLSLAGEDRGCRSGRGCEGGARRGAQAASSLQDHHPSRHRKSARSTSHGGKGGEVFCGTHHLQQRGSCEASRDS